MDEYNPLGVSPNVSETRAALDPDVQHGFYYLDGL